MSSPQTPKPSPGPSDWDLSNYVIIAAAASITVSIFSLLPRGWSRWPWKELGGKDDLVAIGAMLMAIAQSVVVCFAAKNGLGQSPGKYTNEPKAKHIVYATDLLFLAAVFANKVAAALYLGRLSNKKIHRRSVQAIVTACPVFFVISIIIVGTVPGAPSLQSKFDPDNIQTIMARWGAYVALTSIIDIAIVVHPCYVIYRLQMPMSSKLSVATAFGLRLILIPISILRLCNLVRKIRGSNVLTAYGHTEFWTQAEMGYTVVAAAIPCLRPLLNAAQSGIFDLERTDSWQQVPPQRPEVPTRPVMEPRIEQSLVQGRGRGLCTSWASATGDESREDQIGEDDPSGITVRQMFGVERAGNVEQN